MKAMKKIVSSVLTVAMLAMSAIPVFAAGEPVLSDTTKTNVENTDTCFAKPTSVEYHTDIRYYMHFNSTADWLEAAQSLKENATAGSQYVMTVVAKPVSGQLWVRVGWDGDASNAWMAIDSNSEGTDLGDGWKRYEKTITMLGDQDTLIMHNSGVTECYIDSVSIVPVGGGADLMMDSEFDNVSYDAETDTITSTSMNLPASVIMQWEAVEAENTYSLHFKAGADDWLEVSQDFTTPLSAGQYVITAYAKPVTGKIWFRVYNDPDNAWMATHAADVIAVQPDGWTKYQKTVTVNGSENTKLFFHNDQDAEFYIDDISVVAVGGDENLMPDGGFGEVTVIEQPELVLSDTTKVNVENTDTCFAKPTSVEYHTGIRYYMHFNSTADWLEAAQSLKENATAGSQYVMTVVAKPVSGQLWVRVGWDGDASNAWMAIDTSSEGTDLGDGWKRYEKTITMLGDQNTLIMHNSGVTECYIDSVSIVPVGGGADLMMDSEFDNVSYDAETDTITSTSMNLPASVTMQWEAVEAENTYSLHFKAGADDWLEVSQDFTTPLSAGQYVITAYAKPVTGKIWFRVYNDPDNAWMATHAADVIEVQPDGWTKYQKTVTVNGSENTKLFFHNDQDAEFYIDDISVVAVGGDENLMPDGGFGEVTVPEQEPEVPEIPEEPVLSDTTKVNVENTETCFAKATSDEYHAGGNAYMYYKTGGDWLEVNQTLKATATAGSQYEVTVEAKPVSGLIWLRVGWDGDDGAWMAIDASAEGTDLGNGWKRYKKTVTMAGDQNTMIIYNGTAAEWYIDSVSLKSVDTGAELMMDSGFDAVSYDAETDTITSTSMNLPAATATTEVKMLWEEKEAENSYSLHFKAGGSDWLEVSQDFAAPLSAGQYVITAYAKPVTGKLWFYVNWDANGWMATHAADVIALQPDGWTKYQKTVTVDGEDDTKLLFHNDGASEFYIDDISVVKVGSTTELMPDGGFGEVTIPRQEPEVPDTPAAEYEISKPAFKGLTAGGELQSGTVEVTTTIKNFAMGNQFSPIMLLALYDGTRLCDVSTIEQVIAERADSVMPADEVVLTINVPESGETSDYKLRIMYWDGLDTFEPLSEVNIVD